MVALRAAQVLHLPLRISYNRCLLPLADWDGHAPGCADCGAIAKCAGGLYHLSPGSPPDRESLGRVGGGADRCRPLADARFLRQLGPLYAVSRAGYLAGGPVVHLGDGGLSPS